MFATTEALGNKN